jgi:tRNA A-37 threonylcarbamoyl transferase component Bud32/tetratricopeptide (TPR) repeat protein
MEQHPTGLPSLLGGRYQLLRELGRGATATVYLATDSQHGREVAVKILHQALARALGPERFLREIRIAARLNHPNILPLHDSGEADGFLYYVMPFAAGDTLRRRMTREVQLPVEDALRIACDVADGLAHAHEQGVVHRDIKPENILLEGGRAVVADFGIARALSGTEMSISSSGLAVGTPGYMSPEQSSAGKDVDARSDVYSLGCVLYEMLAGEQLFAGPTPHAVASRHLHEHVPSLKIVRPGVPAWLQSTIETALAKVPADRYRSAAEFGRALRAGESGARPALRRSPWFGLGLILLLATAAAGGFLLWRRLRGPALDPQLYAVVPFIHLEGVSAHQLINGANCATLASEALRRWRDLSRVDGLRLDDLIERRGERPTNLRGAIALARAAGAGRLIWGELRNNGAFTVVRGVLIDTRKADQPIRDSQITWLSTGNDSIPLLFAAMVDSLVSEGQPPPSRGSTQPFAAVQAFAAGMAARGDWDLAGALREFRRALAADPSYPAGNLRVAEVSQWLEESPGDWRASAAVASASTEGLSAVERLHASALLDFADQRYPESCGRYRELIRRDSSDFAAWYGLGECQRRDRLVEADPASASGWRFRSSYEAAAQAYLKALGIVPSAHRASQELMLRGLLESLITTPGEYRPGQRGPADSRQFGAFPVLVSDTLAFVPYPLDSLLGGGRGSALTSSAAALERDGRMLDDLTRRLVEVLPNSASAWGARAGVLERAGLLQLTREESALESIRRARGLAATEAGRLSLALAEIRVQLKLGEFVVARTLADSVLRRWADVTGDQAMQLAPLAGLLGKWQSMVRLTDVGAGGSAFIGPAGEVFHPPASLARPALRLLVHAALGGPRDSLEVLEARLARQAAAWPVPQERAALTMALLANPAQLGFPTFGLRPIHDPRKAGPFLLTLQALLVRGDSAGLRRRLADLDALRHNAAVQSSQVGLDAVYQEAWLRLTVGDSAAAASTLDDALESLPLQRALLFRQIHGPASLVYAMALRAQLAARRGEPERARRWALAVVGLWQNADPGLALDLRAMRALAGTQ